MVGGLKIIQVKPGQDQQFEKIFTELQRDVGARGGLPSILAPQVS